MRKAGRIPEGEHAEACTDSATCFALCLQQSHRTPNKESTDDETGMSKHRFKYTYQGGRNTRCMQIVWVLAY